MSESRDIIVVGGGAVALATALAAAKAGGKVLRLSSDSNAAGRHYALGLRARRFLKSVGAEVEGAVARRFWLFSGGQRAEVAAEECGLDSLCHVVSESELLELLRRAARDIPRTEAESFSDLHWDANGVGICADGREYRAGLIAAADGARSRLAELAGVGACAHVFGQAALSMTLRAPLPEDVAAQWFSSGDILALLPLPRAGAFSMIWTLPDSEARRLAREGAKAVARAAAERIGMPEVDAWDESNGDESGVGVGVGVFGLASVRRAVRVCGRMVFLGEAARAVHPLAGQGLNLGLRDAEDLIGRASCFSDWGEGAALSSHAASRVVRAEALHRATRFFAECGAGAATGALMSANYARPLFRAAARFANGY